MQHIVLLLSLQGGYGKQKDCGKIFGQFMFLGISQLRHVARGMEVVKVKYDVDHETATLWFDGNNTKIIIDIKTQLLKSFTWLYIDRVFSLFTTGR